MTAEPTQPDPNDEPSLMRDACYPREQPSIEQTLDGIFDHARYYAWNDPETLQHETVEECLEDWLEYHYEKGIDIHAQIAKDAPVEVTAYNRNEITPLDIRATAESLAERTQEDFADEFGDQDGDVPGLDDAAYKALEDAFEQAIAQVFAERGVHSWRCEEVATRVYSAEDVEKLMREYDASMFEETEA